MHIFKNPQFDFLRWRWPAAFVSAVIIAAGMWMIATKGLPKGIEFSGGTIVIVKFSAPVGEDQVRAAIPGDKDVQRYGEVGENQLLIRLPQQAGAEQGDNLSADSNRVVDALRNAGLPAFEVVSTEIVGPVIGAELQRKGILATLLSILAITVYIGFRFRMSFALGSIAATFHDVLVTLSFLVFFHYEMSLNIIAAMLTMVGYSMNDMIVIFDRVRENARSRKREPLNVMLNTSLNQTLTRTVITSGTVFLAVLALYLFGGEVLEGFAFTMLVGTLATTYSGWFIAPSLAAVFGSRTTGTATRAPAAESAAPAPSRQPTRKAKPQRKVRAS
jgi:preprotein translocase subunit SecF